MKGINIAQQTGFYKPDRKQEFMSEIYGIKRKNPQQASATEIKATEFFRDMNKYEVLAGKDISEMSEDELLSALRQKQLNPTTMLGRSRVLGQYLAWSEEKYGTNNMFDGLSYIQIIDRIGVAETAWCPISKIEEYTAHILEHNTQIWMKALMLSAYYGIYDGWVENLNYLNLKNISGRTVKTYDGRVVQVDDEYIQTITECANITAIMENLNGTGVMVKAFTYPYQDESSVFKGLARSGESKKQTDTRRFKYYINALDDLADVDVSLINIRDTGIVIRLSELAKENGDNLIADLESLGDLTTTGYSKTWKYNGYLYQLGYELNWSLFVQKYSGWRRMLKSIV